MRTTTFMRRISALVLLTFTSLTLQPLQAVAQAKLQAQAAQVAPPSDDEQYAKLLDAIKETARRGTDKANTRGAVCYRQASLLWPDVDNLNLA